MILDLPFFRPDLLVPLIAGHFLGDFVLQADWMVERKRRFGVVLLHAAIVAIVSCLLLGHVPSWWWLFPTLLVTHLLVDLLKGLGDRSIGRYGSNARVALFLLDQAAHLIVLAAILQVARFGALSWGSLVGESAWVALFGVGYLRALVLVTGWIVTAPAVGVLLGLVLTRFEDELTPDQKAGLPGGGYWIGLTERSLIYLFLLVAEPSGIGFLAAAKSVFRIGELREADERKLAEYILIGTLMSFTLAMVFGLLTRAALSLPWLR